MAGRRSSDGDDLPGVAGIYVVGGQSSLPVVGRVLRELFGRRVHRSAYPSAARHGPRHRRGRGGGLPLEDRLSRHFGVFREAADGRRSPSTRSSTAAC